MKYAFIEQARVNFPVCRLWEVLQIAPSGYDAWRKRKPRPRADLQDAGLICSRKRVARSMRHRGLQGCGRTKRRPPDNPSQRGASGRTELAQPKLHSDAP